MDFNNVSPELREKALACKTSEELIELAREEGIELTDEQLEAVSGGETLWEVMYPDDCANHHVCWGLST